MGMFSILPASLSVLETWVARIFLFFAFLIIGPWLLVLIYDLLLYIWRFATYDIPIIGGRARGKVRPRAPSFTTRPTGHKRHISLPINPQQIVAETDGNNGETTVSSSSGRSRSSSNAVTYRESSKSQDEMK